MNKLNIPILLYTFPLTLKIFTDGMTSAEPYCEIRERKFTILYNFTKLSRPSNDFITNHQLSKETIRMQLCTSLINKCNGKDGYAVCLTKNNAEIGLGKVPPIINNDSGKIAFKFTGDNCAPGTSYTTTVVMQCDYLAVGYSNPEIFSNDQCNYYLIWKTEYACGPRVQMNCTIEDQGHQYDLSPLTRYSDNYIIYAENKTRKIILNVCHSVIHGYEAICQLSSGICLEDSTNLSDIKYINLGDVHKPIFLQDKVLKLQYDNGNICKSRGAQHIQTTINFICDFEATNTLPEYISGSEECHYHLIWKTSAACDVDDLRKYNEAAARKCTVPNSMYNLQSLMNKDYNVTVQNGLEYKFSICGPLTDKTCKSGSGVCLMKDGISIGTANSNLMWEQGGPYLNYTNGDVCKDNVRRYTIIAFLCGAEGSSNKPLVVYDHPCQMEIHWNTDLVCDERTKCSTEGNEFNLSPLIRSDTNYIVKVNNTQFYINVCRPVVPTLGLVCPHGSAVCKVSSNPNDKLSENLSLGFPKENPKLDKDGRRVFLRYFGGSTCPEKTDSELSSNFTFVCDNINQGFPEFKEYKECTYIFEWRTNLVCGAVIGRWIPPCIIRDESRSKEYDLSLLYKKQQTYKVKSEQGKEYNIQICEGDKRCNNAAVCDGTNDYGSLMDVVLDYSQNEIKLKYSNKTKCGNASYTSEIRLVCNESAGTGQPWILWEWECNIAFEWHTNVVCAYQQTPELVTDTPHKNATVQTLSASHVGMVTGIVLTVVVVIVVIYYFHSPEKREKLRSCFNTCTSRRGSGRVQYCRVNTTEEARLLLDASDPTQCQTDSDDDLLGA